MRWKRLLMVTALTAGAAGPAAAQARAEAQVRAAPRDIREVFLAVPYPDFNYIDDDIHLDSTLATFARRRAALEAALARGEPNVLDLRNGYLKIRVADETSDADTLELVMTYFNREDGKRLVVMQANRCHPNCDEPNSIDFFWTLDGGSYTQRYWNDVVPGIGVEDFWGDQPLTESQLASFESELDPTHVEWPRQGTTARLRIFTPRHLLDGEDGENAEYREMLVELLESRRYDEIELVWDRRRGVFTKGRKTPYESEEHHHH